MRSRLSSTLRDTADALARGAAVLTATADAAMSLQTDLQDAGFGTEVSPRVLPWGAWTSHLWHRALLLGAADRMLLNRSQEDVLWRAEMAKDPAVATLHSPRALARLASDAFRLLGQHHGLRALAGSATNSDTETFVRVAAAFERRCRAEGYLPKARLESSLRRIVVSGAFTPQEPGLFLAGFDRLLPAQSALLEALVGRGMVVEHAATPVPPCNAMLRVAAEPAEELLAAAQDARRFLDRHPGARVALLIPGLESDRLLAAQADRVLRQVLAPEMEDITAGRPRFPYRIAGGAPLAYSEAIASALDLLAWVAAPLALERVSRLLRSLHFAAEAERHACAEFDAFELRRELFLRPEATLDQVLAKLAGSPRRDRLVALRSRLRAVQAKGREALGAPSNRSWTAWSETMRALLAAAGWAAAPPVDQADDEVRRAWESCLDELSTLDFDGSVVRYGEALETLCALSGESILQQSMQGEPIQVLPPEGAPGLEFDAVWWLGAGDLTWPGGTTGNPLLSWPLRRELGLPGSDPAADHAKARRLAESVVACAPLVTFSYSRRKEDEIQRASPVLAGLVLAEQAVTLQEPSGVPMVELEAAADLLPLPYPQDQPVSGGAGVLKAQAACAFRAFAEYRLFATDLETREPGLNARERGVAVHRVLERFWEAVVSQDALRRMTDAGREALLEQCVDAALAAATEQIPWDAAYLVSQRRRLLSLVRRWLQVEAARKLPFTVVSRESRAPQVAIGPLQVKLRIDRIDHTEEGAVLIDYKTGAVEPSGWSGERPDEPQLPLYAVLAGETRLHALAFATVRAGERNMALVGIEESWGTLTKRGKPPAERLEQQIETWREVLTELATRFSEGDTEVAPKQYPKTCKNCSHRLLCRLNPATLTGSDDEEESPPARDGHEDQAFG